MSDPTPHAGPPAEITHLVRERTEARARRDWPRADALKAQIEAAGWRVTDHGSRTSVGPAAPPSMEIGGEVRYGSASAVRSLLDEPATAAWTVMVIASEEPERLSRLLGALRAHVPAGTQVVIVANDPSAAQVVALDPAGPDRAPIGGGALEVLRTSSRLGHAAALNIGLRRSIGEFVLLADATARPAGDALSPLAAALEDPTVAAAGGFGLIAAEPGPLRPTALRRRDAVGTAPDGTAADGAATTTDATALEGAWLAFRRSDYVALGPLDEHFVTPAWLDVWWTLRLRAGAEPVGGEYVEPEGSGEPEGWAAVRAAEASASEFAPPEVSLVVPRRAVLLKLPLEGEEVAVAAGSVAPQPPEHVPRARPLRLARRPGLIRVSERRPARPHRPGPGTAAITCAGGTAPCGNCCW